MPDMQTINLRTLRKERNLTLHDVGKEVGADPGQLSRIERGDPPSWDLANKLAKFYGVTLDDAFRPSNPVQ
jgi:transcriptional regulator with XRE-family HTH domain